MSHSPLVYLKVLYRLPLLAVSALVCFLYARATGDRRAVRLWATLASAICRRRLVVTGSAPDPCARLVIANHVSYVDLIPIFWLWPECHPVAMNRIRSWPLVGRLLHESVIFVDETDAESRASARQAIRDVWRAGRAVLVFPEGLIERRRGTFRVGCFEEAIRAGVSIQGARLSYPRALLAALDGRLFEERFFWVLCQNFPIRVEIFPAELARGDPAALAARWEARLLAREGELATAPGSSCPLSSPC